MTDNQENKFKEFLKYSLWKFEKKILLKVDYKLKMMQLEMDFIGSQVKTSNVVTPVSDKIQITGGSNDKQS